MRERSAIWCAVVVTALCACASASRSRRQDPVWPRPPEEPRARWSGSFPAPDSAGVPWWRRAWTVIVGEPRDDARQRVEAIERPLGVSATARDLVVVADPGGGRVVRIEWARSTTTSLECPDRAWDSPTAVVAFSDRVVYVADGADIVKWTPSGCSVLRGNAIERATSLAADSGRVFVVDSPRHEVVVFEASAEVARFGRDGPLESRLHHPVGVAVDPTDGTLLVVDALNFRVCRFDRTGKFLGAFGQAGARDGSFVRPKGIAVDESGRIFVADGYRDTVLVFDRGGGFLFSVGASGATGGQLGAPAGVDVTGSALYVASSGNGRIERYELLGGAP